MPKEITLNVVAGSVDNLTKTVNGLVKSVEDLAIITRSEFENVHKEFASVRQELGEASAERKGMKRDIEEIKLKFAYCAWQIDLEEVKKRIAVVEQKIGIKRESR